MSIKMPSDEENAAKDFKPSHYMRARRPHLFSDTTIEHETSVTREVLSYHLETLTNQKDETKFENFAQGLASKFISPNLRPQTGPVGGGDGKTDSETYPVTSEVASRWFVPDLAGSNERWAFAFSAKKDWRGKVRSDVANIAGTGRHYPHIYFITNQFVPSKDSAAVQDSLLAKHKIPVTILDRTWLLERVFDHNSLDIAIDTLGVGAGTEQRIAKQGPRDFKRASEFAVLQERIGDATNYIGTATALADDCLKAALLARGIERSREEVEGLFQRAIRVARDNDLSGHQLVATYNLAWTSFFWFDDFKALNQHYDSVELLALSSSTAEDLERLSNLLPLIRNSVSFGKLPPEDAKLASRGESLLGSLDRVRADSSRPNNALHAHALSLMTRLARDAQADQPDLDPLFDEFRDVILQADGLGTFPFQSIADALTEVGSAVVESVAFDRLYEVITDALAARKSEGEAARKNSERGYQKLERGLSYDAIRWFGRAVSLLVKDEYEAELLQALLGSSMAYEEAGLLWASRNYALAAASHEGSAFQRSGSVSLMSASILKRHLWTEIRLGRIPYVLAASELLSMVRGARAKTSEQRERAIAERDRDSETIGALLLRTEFTDLPRISQLPDGLERIGLGLSRMAAMFLLGHEETLRKEEWVPPSETAEGYQTFFEQWAAIGLNSGLPKPDYMFGDDVLLRSNVLGCEVQVTCANNLTSIGIGEAILGALESLLATSLPHRMLPHLDVLRLTVRPIESADLTPILDFGDDTGFTVGSVTHAPRLVCTTREEALAFPRWLHDAVIQIFVRFAVPADMDKWTSTVLKEESGFSRALTFSHVPNMMGVLFGSKSRLSIDQWIDSDAVDYDVKRSEPWKFQPIPTAAPQLGDLKFGEGPPPDEMLNPERLKHSDMQIVSPIDVYKWDAARWIAVLFQYVPDAPHIPPVLALAFEDGEAALGIFRGFANRYGQHDPQNDLRIAIIKGVIKSNPHAYAVIVGPNPSNFSTEKGSTFGFISRINVMTPSSNKNLNNFLAEFQRHGRFALAAAHLSSRTGQPEPIDGPFLGKYHLDVREAWQISENDPDGVVLNPDDPPIIPADQPDAPVLKALAWMAKMRDR